MDVCWQNGKKMKYNVGDKLIYTQHGTDHSTVYEYIITDIHPNRVDLKGVGTNGGYIETDRLDHDLKKYNGKGKFKIVNVNHLPEDLFTL